MKGMVLFCGVLVVVIVGLIFLYEAQAGEPKVLIPETSWDYGYVPGGSVISHFYLVKNVGTDTLKIKSVNPG
jgi:hypothetical protein